MGRANVELANQNSLPYLMGMDSECIDTENPLVTCNIEHDVVAPLKTIECLQTEAALGSPSRSRAMHGATYRA